MGIGYWILGIGLRAVAGCVKVQGLSLSAEQSWRSSTIYYSTKVRFCDRDAEILILVCQDLWFGGAVFGG